MKIALAQLNSVNQIQKNLAEIEKIISDCAKLSEQERPRVIFFPENSLFFRIEENEKIQALKIEDPVFKTLQNISLKTQLYIHLTTAIQQNEKTWNASVLISPEKPVEIMYKKIHLFDIALEGQKPIKESDVFQYGLSPSVFEIDGVKFGSSICYDIRFSELYSYYAKSEVDVILVPSAFLVKTGLAHWEVLLRARAIESQAYVLAPAQSGKHHSVMNDQSDGQVVAPFRETFGHSMGISPWGEVLGVRKEGSGVIFIDIDKQKCHQMRQQIPMKSHRRL